MTVILPETAVELATDVGGGPNNGLNWGDVVPEAVVVAMLDSSGFGTGSRNKNSSSRMNRYVFRGNNSVISVLIPFSRMWSTLKGKNLLLGSKFFFFKSRPILGKIL